MPIPKGMSCRMLHFGTEIIFAPHPSPQGTDQSFLQKLHHELGSHGNFLKGEDKRRWEVEFGIRHYAGPVTYKVRNFLEKNKDVQQEMFFDFLEQSRNQFAREITRYRVCLATRGCSLQFYYVFSLQDLLTTYMETAKKRATKSKSLISGTRTGKVCVLTLACGPCDCHVTYLCRASPQLEKPSALNFLL